MHTYTAGNPLPCGKILRAVFIGMSAQKYAAGFRGAVRFEGNTAYKMCIECYNIVGEITVDLISNIHQAGYFKAISCHHYVVKCLSNCSATM